MRCVVANWKMNLLTREVSAFCEAFMAGYSPVDDVQAAIAPPFPWLVPTFQEVRSKGVRVFAQNAHFEEKGAFTGEVSMAMLRDAGCTGVILGHSERRTLFGETDEALGKKLAAARAHGLLPLLCVGETLHERDTEQTYAVLKRQLGILAADPGPLWVAYEPVWAIGTGRRADVNQIRDAHRFIREELRVHMGEAGEQTPILYGGSVTPETFGELLEIPEVAGGLVGGASLDPDKFLSLVKTAQG
ncbi:MAG TPA: triose-phosphate isomerase [Holophagaceae bacterium]|nr:triose-phosphate isomerase [Holophagaceae bacterium]